MDFGDFSGPNSLKIAQAIREKMLSLMNGADSKTVTVSAGGGMVTVTASLNSQIVSLELEREVVNPDDTEMLSDLIVAAVNQALEQVQQEIVRSMGDLAAQLKVPLNSE
jgi:DNA-binding YbaB/EbfC family protein